MIQNKNYLLQQDAVSYSNRRTRKSSTFCDTHMIFFMDSVTSIMTQKKCVLQKVSLSHYDDNKS